MTNIGMGDHLGLNFITTMEDLAVLKQVVVQNVSPDGMAVLNACDPKVVEMAIALSQPEPRWSNACRADIPLTRGGTVIFQVDNVMAAVAVVWALELDWALIRKGLRSFDSDVGTTPGRFNLFEYRGATLIADYGHNPDAILALAKAVEAMPAQRRIAVISGAGDRRDEDIREQSRILGGVFDEVVLYQDQCQRGRTNGEVLALLQEGLKNASRTRVIEEVTGEFLAINTALSHLKSGDLCLILIDQVDDALAHIAKRIAGA